jgi:membrane protein
MTLLLTSYRIVVRAAQQWVANQDSRLGAALAYYTLFSIAPLLVIAIHIAGFVFGEDAARGKVVEHLSALVGKELAEWIQGLVVNAAEPRSGIWAIVGFVFIVIGALSVFLHVRGALCTIWKLEPPHGNTLLAVLVDYFLAFVMVIVTGILLLLSLAAGMVVPILRHVMDEQFPGNGFQWQVIEFWTSVLFLTLLFAAIFRILSGQRIAWRYVVYGSVATAVLFTLGKIALGMYLVYASPASTYGAAGSLVVFLIWVYYSSQILFFGAELVQARRTRHEWMGR